MKWNVPICKMPLLFDGVCISFSVEVFDFWMFEEIQIFDVRKCVWLVLSIIAQIQNSNPHCVFKLLHINFTVNTLREINNFLPMTMMGFKKLEWVPMVSKIFFFCGEIFRRTKYIFVFLCCFLFYTNIIVFTDYQRI